MCRGPPPHAWGVHAQPQGLWEQHGAAQHPAGPRCCYKPERLAAPPWTTGRPRLCHRGCPEGTVCLPGVHPTSAWLGFITGKWGCSAGDAPRGLRSGLRFGMCAHPWSLPLPLHPRGREAGVGVVRGEGPAPRGAWWWAAPAGARARGCVLPAGSEMVRVTPCHQRRGRGLRGVTLPCWQAQLPWFPHDGAGTNAVCPFSCSSSTQGRGRGDPLVPLAPWFSPPNIPSCW